MSIIKNIKKKNDKKKIKNNIYKTLLENKKNIDK